MNGKELKKDKLYLCDIEWTYEDSNTGETVLVKEKLVGFVRDNSEEDFFFGCTFGLYKGRMCGGDSMNMSLEEFNDQVKSVKEIA